MKNMSYIAANHIDSDTTITPSTEDSTFTVENIYNKRIGKPFKFTGKTGNIVFDFGSETTIFAIALLGHNLSSGATITLQSKSSDSWGDPYVDESITWRAADIYQVLKTGTITLAAIEWDTGIEWDGAHDFDTTPHFSQQYWRLVIDDNGCADSQVKFGEIYLYTGITTLSQNFNWGSDETDEYINNIDYTEYMQPWVYSLTNRKSFAIDFEINDAATDAELRAWQTAAQGNKYPFVFIPDPDETDCYYVRFSSDLSLTRKFTTHYISNSIKLIEDPKGKSI